MFSKDRWVVPALIVSSFGLISSAGAQTAAEEMIYYPNEADEYFFFEETDRKKVADYKTDQTLRVCVEQNTHLVPMRVIYDDQQATVEPGDCFRFEAREVSLEPDDALEQGWVLKADVQDVTAS